MRKRRGWLGAALGAAANLVAHAPDRPRCIGRRRNAYLQAPEGERGTLRAMAKGRFFVIPEVLRI